MIDIQKICSVLQEIDQEITTLEFRIETLTEERDSYKNAYDRAMSKLDQPPDGYPSWEDFLAKNEVFIEWVGSEWVVSNYGMSGREKTKHGTYPTALAAAKKEAGR